MARIGIDATAMRISKKGIARYQKNLIKSLHSLNLKHEFFVFCHDDLKADFQFDDRRWHFIKVPRIKQIVWDFIQLPWVVKTYRLELVHTIYERIPLWSSASFVVHLFEDPAYRFKKSLETGQRRRWYQRWAEAFGRILLPLTLRKARMVPILRDVICLESFMFQTIKSN